MAKRKHWSEYSTERTQYGLHRLGIGVYRVDKNYKPIEWWLDWESATQDEIKRYRKYLRRRKLWQELRRQSPYDILLRKIKQIRLEINSPKKAKEFLQSTGAYTMRGRLKKKWK